jgi:uncharacterized protein with von Willebrand factor type A (vWA) domain
MTATTGVLALNVMHFARLLRRTGLPVGAGDIVSAALSLEHIDLGERNAVHAALRAVMVHRHDHHEMFDQAFSLFWRNPDASRFAAAMAALEGKRPDEQDRAPPGSRRVAEAMATAKERQSDDGERPQEIGTTWTFSEREKLQAMDFEAMSAKEIAMAKNEIGKLRLPLDQHRTRRWRPDAKGSRGDLRATIRNSLRSGGEVVSLSRRERVIKPPPLVVLCDISGSMAQYAQILLHFVHSVANDRDRVSVFLFGTRLSNVTRQLRHRDPEVAFNMISSMLPDWSGGTRIGESIAEFNRLWGRRVLGQGAVVLLVTDGLDRDGTKMLGASIDRLHRSCRRLIWLNPLLRWDGFSPKAQGAKAMLPHVDEFRPVHNLASLKSLIASLSAAPPPRGFAASQWRDLL